MNENDRVRETWERMAGAWHDQRAWMLETSRPVHDWLVAALDPQPGEQILEIGAGPGDTGFLAAKRLGPDGRLLSTDLAPAMVDAAARRGAELGVTNADYQVLDAQAMDLADGRFDGVLSRWGYMLMPDPLAALRETLRVLKPGGRLSLAVFTGPADNPWAAIPARLLVQRGHLPPPQPGAPSILALGDRARLEGLIEAAGFTSWEVEAVPMAWNFPSFDAYWIFLSEITALGPVVRGLGDADRTAFQADLREQLAPFAQGDGLAVPGRCWGGLARR